MKARAIVFALAAGAVAFILSIIPNLGQADHADIIGRAVIPAIVVAVMCWAAAERAVAATAEAIDAAILRLAQAARGDLDSAIPTEVGVCVPQLSAAMADLFVQLNASMDRVERMAMFDSVTGLPNRDHFRSRCESMVGEVAPDGRAALLFIDLDRFKAVNDTLGHATGDLLLAQVAQRLRAAVADAAPAAGKPPVIGRLAGDEFTVLLPRIDNADEARRLGDVILDTLTRPFDVNAGAIDIGASIGIALSPEHGSALGELMKAADIAMYQAKADGGGRVAIFTPALNERLNARAVLDHELRRAVAADEFQLVFRPQGASYDGRPTGVEALLRWRHPTQGLLPPTAFLPRAEETGAIVEIDDWTMATVAATIARSSRAGMAQRLSIGVGGRKIDPADFFRGLHAALCAAAAPAHLLELTLTESLAMRCSPEALQALAELRVAGAVIAIDDFGAGYFDLPRLRTLPVDRIRLDPRVLADVVADPRARATAQALVGLIHGLGCEAVAKGIESRAQAEMLHVIGCDTVQGRAIAEPMNEAAYLAWVGQPTARVSSAA